jgi:hypothetical protein
MSNSHHHGQQLHQIGQHGQQSKQNVQLHQQKHAVKFPLGSAETVTSGVCVKPQK